MLSFVIVCVFILYVIYLFVKYFTNIKIKVYIWTIILLMKKAIIIGSGFSSLAAACYHTKSGLNVTVLEKNEQLGGRASMMEVDEFKFDMGPSWYWMPDVFERFFADFGKSVSDYYTLEKLSPAYRVVFGKNDFIDIEDTPEKIIPTLKKVRESI